MVRSFVRLLAASAIRLRLGRLHCAHPIDVGDTPIRGPSSAVLRPHTNVGRDDYEENGKRQLLLRRPCTREIVQPPRFVINYVIDGLQQMTFLPISLNAQIKRPAELRWGGRADGGQSWLTLAKKKRKDFFVMFAL